MLHGKRIGLVALQRSDLLQGVDPRQGFDPLQRSDLLQGLDPLQRYDLLQGLDPLKSILAEKSECI